MRLLALIAVGYLLFRAVKTWMSNHSGGSLGRPPGADQPGPQIDDAMLKDPQCGIYFSKRDGVELVHKGQSLDFCSPECRDEFLKSQARETDVS